MENTTAANSKAKLSPQEREAMIKEIIHTFMLLGLCEPSTEEEKCEVEARREKIGAERFDQFAVTAAEGVTQFIEETEAAQA